MIKKHLHILSLALIICLASSCKNDTDKKPINNSQESKPQHTQALILTQDYPYDAKNKSKIIGPYIKHQKLELPKDIVPQSKWFMFEGPVLENELVAYRYYADSRHRFDIYGKKVLDLVMDTVSWDYHDIMDWGSDILKVGNSLGLGSPAIYYQDSIYALSHCDRNVIEIIESSKVKSTIRTTFTNLQIDNHSFDLIQDWSIEAGSPMCEMRLQVANGTLPEGLKFATGIVKHLPEISEGEVNDHFYAYNWGKQSFHNEQMGMAIASEKKYGPTLISNKLSHAYVFNNAASEVTYQFGSVWEQDKNDVKNADQFKMLLETSFK